MSVLPIARSVARERPVKLPSVPVFLGPMLDDWLGDIASVPGNRGERPLLSEADAMHSTDWVTGYAKVWPKMEELLSVSRDKIAAVQSFVP